MEAAAFILLGNSENQNNVVVLKIMDGTEPRNSLQLEMEGCGDGFTGSKEQMEEQRLTLSNLPFVNCFVSLRTH